MHEVMYNFLKKLVFNLIVLTRKYSVYILMYVRKVTLIFKINQDCAVFCVKDYRFHELLFLNL